MTPSEQILSLTKQLAVLPAPSGNEEERASFCLEWLQKNGVGAFCDEVQNVIVECGDVEHDPIVLFMAHTDIVFDRTVPLTLREEGGRLYCPGIGDDTAHVAFLLYAAKKCFDSPKPNGVSFVFAANVCEEGEGNLRGCRALTERYGSRLREVISFDSYLPTVNIDAVGSKRYRITAKTAGGHSFRDFGSPNAIALLSELICELNRQPLPQSGKTTFNFGGISGGTTVNTIAANASLLYEFRSDRDANLEQMERQFQDALACFREHGAWTVETVGVRPCAKGVDPERQSALIGRILQAFDGLPVPSRTSGSTDCNLPLSMGIPAVCVGLVQGAGAHTTKEYILPDSISDGVSVLHRLLASYGVSV